MNMDARARRALHAQLHRDFNQRHTEERHHRRQNNHHDGPVVVPWRQPSKSEVETAVPTWKSIPRAPLS
jgi:hypothetical protein